jgi:hypothetical protein
VYITEHENELMLKQSSVYHEVYSSPTCVWQMLESNWRPWEIKTADVMMFAWPNQICCQL